MCAPSAPPAPNYQAAAQEQGNQNVRAARTQARLNTPNVVNPYGSQTVTWGTGFNQEGYDSAMRKYEADMADYRRAYDLWDRGGYQSTDSNTMDMFGRAHDWADIFGFGGDGIAGPREGPFNRKRPTAPKRDSFILNPDQATLTQTFSPEQQRIYDLQTQVKQLLGGLGVQGATALQGVVGKELDFSGLPAMPGNATGTRNKVIDAMMARVNEDTGVARETANSDLIAAGIRPGSKAYDRKMHLIDRSYNDARNQAFLASGQEASRDFGLDSERRRQAITELLSQRQVPLNEITALMSGSQVSNPFAMPGYAGGGQVQPAPTFAAQNALAGYNTDLYNAQAAQAGNMQGGLMGLGGTAIMGGMMLL